MSATPPADTAIWIRRMFVHGPLEGPGEPAPEPITLPVDAGADLTEDGGEAAPPVDAAG